MRLSLVVVVVCLLGTNLIDAKSKGKRKWHDKKLRSKYGHVSISHPKIDKSSDVYNSMDKKGELGWGQKMPDQKVFWDERRYKKMKKGKHMKMKKHKKGYKKHTPWLNVKKETDCDIPCKQGEVCISGPIDTKPICVRKRDLKKSMKLFHRYQKKEMKAWKKFQKKKYHDFNANYNGFKKGDDMEKDFKLDKMDKNKYDAEKFANLKEEHLKKMGSGHPYHNKKAKKGKSKDKEPAPYAFVPGLLIPKDAKEECSTGKFTQMRTRLMGWFHLLHGQDKLARKSHGGSIKHFYKHVSVKKELREFDGQKCGCLKSAMWQFHQMDKDSDDNLNSEELSYMEENSLEPCVQPFLASCDGNADGKISSSEWCCCFSNIVAPCYRKVDEIRRSEEPVTYMPRCDKEGYYMREQCRENEDTGYQCWCVDYNGNEYKGTFTSGRAHCSKKALVTTDETPVA